MYGSSFRMLTRNPRAFSSRPTLAAVMPLPREEVTPPVTKTYFAMGRVLRGVFRMLLDGAPRGNLSRRVVRPEGARANPGGAADHAPRQRRDVTLGALHRASNDPERGAAA